MNQLSRSPTLSEVESNLHEGAIRSSKKFGKIKTSLVIACLAALTPTPSSSFTQSSINYRKRKLSSSRQHFRVEGEGLAYVTKDVISSQSTHAVNSNVPSTSEHMPVWLRQQTGEHAEKLLAELEAIATERYFSETEAKQIVSAIKSAAKGDQKKVAGAAQLCQILVETMDMAVDIVTAAAYHYCSCFEAREKTAFLNQLSPKPSTTFISSLWNVDDHCDLEKHNLNPEVAKILRDTALLKKTEMVASSLVQAIDYDSLRVLLLSETKDWRALAIRSAASLYRLQGIIQAHSQSNEQKRYTPEEMRAAREALHIYAPLTSRLGMHRLKNELEGTAFRILYRRQYETVTELTEQTRKNDRSNYLNLSEGMKLAVAEITERVEDVLKSDRMLRRYTKNVVVSARVKQPFSLWKKMLRTGARNPLDVPDALALRVVLDGKKQTLEEDDKVTQARERALCYYVRTLCTERWRPDTKAPRFKDYVEKPKKNGYQSLHYSANTEWEGDDWNFEIQIRSGEMHQVAEYGLAAHWDYKLGNKSNENKHSSDAYLKSVEAWHWQQLGHSRSNVSQFTQSQSGNATENKIRAERERENAERLAPYIESFSNARSNLTRNQVFVFLSPTEGSNDFDGKIISLPSGSCVMDALREGEKRYGITTNFLGYGVVQNDKETLLTRRLSNGDVLKVPAVSTGSMLSM